MATTPYEHPLYSFTLLPDDARGAEDGRYAVPMPQGRLVVSPALRARGERLCCDTIVQAVSAGLAFQARDPAGFTRYGLGPEWAAAMRYWQGRLHDTEQALMQLGVVSRLRTKQLTALRDAGRDTWRHLMLCSRFCSKAGLIVKGESPRARGALRDGLTVALQRVHENAEALACHGFGPQQVQDLTRLIADLGAQDQDAAAAAWRRRELSGQAMVIRGALQGDLVLLTQAAPRVLGQKAAAGLRLGRILVPTPLSGRGAPA